MNEKIKVIYNNEELFLAPGTSLLEISKTYQKDFKYPIVLANLNNYWTELNEVVTKDSKLEFYDLTSREGNRVYLSGLVYLAILATKNLYDDKIKLQIHHSIDKGILLETSNKITKEDVAAIEQEMKKLVASDLPIKKINSKRLEVIDYYETLGEDIKAKTLKYNPSTTITIYEIENEYNYFYSQMPVTTKVLNHFALNFLDDKGFVLRIPTVYANDQIKDYQHKPKMYDLFQRYRKWETAMNLKTAADLNEIVSSGKIGDIIKIDEMRQSSRLMGLAKTISTEKKVKIILVAGPSSSGKTTTSKKIELYLKGFGMNPIAISMDDYFVEREETPILENGNPDYENITAVDLKLFESNINDLINNKEVNVPSFNFLTGKKEYKKKLKLEKEDIIVIEGIHALNPSVLEHVDNSIKFKIYLSALTEINIDNHNRMPTTDNRLLRRIIRDNKTRGHDVDKTLSTWSDVRKGEEKYIFPYQEEADIIFNTALVYELGVLKTYVEPLLYSVKPDSPNYSEAIRLINHLRVFLPIPSEDIPDDSILREFIGNSYF